jgi:DNA (cytosine-5)-methyltransferase 1
VSKPRLLDLFCCEGGASVGYHRAGFDVYGVDLFKHKNAKGQTVGFSQDRYPFPSTKLYGVDLFRYRDESGKLKGFSQKRYPFASCQGDVLIVMALLLAGESIPFTHKDGRVEYLRLSDFAAIAGSPPCQAYSITKHTHSNVHAQLVEPTRDALIATGKPYVIENVVGAPLLNPLMLCGSEFDLTTIDDDGTPLRMERHRLFESNVWLLGNGGCRHDLRVQVAGAYGGGSVDRGHAKTVRRGGYTPAAAVRGRLLGIDWMTMGGMSQSIPPAYTEHIGRQLLDAL